MLRLFYYFDKDKNIMLRNSKLNVKFKTTFYLYL